MKYVEFEKLQKKEQKKINNQRRIIYSGTTTKTHKTLKNPNRATRKILDKKEIDCFC